MSTVSEAEQEVAALERAFYDEVAALAPPKIAEPPRKGFDPRPLLRREVRANETDCLRLLRTRVWGNAAAAAPPSSVTNSRRRMASISGSISQQRRVAPYWSIDALSRRKSDVCDLFHPQTVR